MASVNELVAQYNQIEGQQADLLRAIIARLADQSGPRRLKVGSRLIMNAQFSEHPIVDHFVNGASSPIESVTEGVS